jgi:hypothetical protein
LIEKFLDLKIIVSKVDMACIRKYEQIQKKRTMGCKFQNKREIQPPMVYTLNPLNQPACGTTTLTCGKS